MKKNFSRYFPNEITFFGLVFLTKNKISIIALPPKKKMTEKKKYNKVNLALLKQIFVIFMGGGGDHRYNIYLLSIENKPTL